MKRWHTHWILGSFTSKICVVRSILRNWTFVEDARFWSYESLLDLSQCAKCMQCRFSGHGLYARITFLVYQFLSDRLKLKTTFKSFFFFRAFALRLLFVYYCSLSILLRIFEQKESKLLDGIYIVQLFHIY